MAKYRFFSKETPTVDSQISMSDEDARHARLVLRLSVGDSVEIFDGKGALAEASIESIGKYEVKCLVVKVQHFSNPSKIK